jgi:hypothetical protein
MTWVDPAEELAAIHRWFGERALELELFQRGDGRWRGMVTVAGESRGTGEYVEGDDELDAARAAQRRHSSRQLRAALDGLSQVAQSEVVQLLAAELMLSRIPGGRSRLGRQAALASAVWMLDPKRRSATRTVGRVAADWAKLRVAGRGAGGAELPHGKAQEMLPAALDATERGLDAIRLRLQQRK